NCIGRIHLNNPNLYSVRFNGRRIASLCLRDNIAVEIKGRWNKSVASEHRPSVTEALNFMKIDLKKSKDLHNIGKKVISLILDTQNIPLLIDESEPLYHENKNSFSVNQIFNGIKQTNIPKIKQKTLKIISPSLQDTVSSLLDDSLQNYIICPLSEYL